MFLSAMLCLIGIGLRFLFLANVFGVIFFSSALALFHSRFSFFLLGPSPPSFSPYVPGLALPFPGPPKRRFTPPLSRTPACGTWFLSSFPPLFFFLEMF